MSAGSVPTVLVVDDDEAVRTPVVWALAEQGYRVREAADGVAALAAATDEAPCVVLLDLRMPGGDGWAFVKAYRAGGGGAPIVLMTAVEEAVRWAKEIGAAGVLSKPFGVLEAVRAAQLHCGAVL